MTELAPVIARIAARWLIPPILIAFGMSEEMRHELLNDPDFILLVSVGWGAALAFIEGLYARARRTGGMT